MGGQMVLVIEINRNCLVVVIERCIEIILDNLTAF